MHPYVCRNDFPKFPIHRIDFIVRLPTIITTHLSIFNSFCVSRVLWFDVFESKLADNLESMHYLQEQTELCVFLGFLCTSGPHIKFV